MSKNGKTEVEEQQQLDTEHELPAAQEPSEAEKLRAERDSLVDRLARMQAEIDHRLRGRRNHIFLHAGSEAYVARAKLQLAFAGVGEAG